MLQLRVKELVKFFFFLLLAILLVVFAFKGIRIQPIVAQIMKGKMQWVFVSFLMSFIALIVRAYRWNLLIEPLSYHPRLRNTFYAVCIGYFANLAFPRLGEITRCGSLSKSESIPFNVLLGTVITERIIDVLSLLVCLCLTTIIEFKRLGNFMSNTIIQPIIRKVAFLWASPVLLLTAIVLATGLIYLAFRYFSSRNRKQNRSANLLKGIIAGIDSIRNLKRPLLFVLHSVLIWLLYYLSVYVALFALPSTEQLGLAAALFLLVAGGFAMSAPVQGGIGAYHLLVSQGLILYGLSQQDGLAFATLLHSLQLILIVLFGSLSLLVLFFGKKQNPKSQVDQTNRGERG